MIAKCHPGPQGLKATVEAIEHRLGSLTLKTGPHWGTWYCGTEEVAGYCDSPYPGPNYGRFQWVNRKYGEMVAGTRVHVMQSRGINGTEAHFLNQRLRAHWAGLPVPRVALIAEVEEVYRLCIEKQVKEVHPGSWTIRWYTHEPLTLGAAWA